VAKEYITGKFIWDLIPLLPFQILELDRKRDRLFYLLKVMRIPKGFILFDVPKLMKSLKTADTSKLKQILDENKDKIMSINLDDDEEEEMAKQA